MGRKWTKIATAVTFRFDDVDAATAWCESVAQGRWQMKTTPDSCRTLDGRSVRPKEARMWKSWGHSTARIRLDMLFELPKDAMMFKLTYGGNL